jgi:hypothetical protein
MWLQLIAHYNKYFELLLTAVILLKLFFFNATFGSGKGFIGIFYSIFKWFSGDERHMAENESEKKWMLISNIISIVIYLLLLIIILGISLLALLKN